MGKLKKFPTLVVKKIDGGKDPLKTVEDFILRLGFDPESVEKEKSSDTARWMFSVDSEKELEVLLEGIRKPTETTVYLGINICTVPIRGASDVLATALEVADGLVGVKVSLVGHFLVLSASLSAVGITGDDLEYHYKLLSAQETWFRQQLVEELHWDDAPMD
jgi:hypothetical protein